MGLYKQATIDYESKCELGSMCVIQTWPCVLHQGLFS